MSQFTVTHPDPQFSGDMLGVQFTAGCGQVDVHAEGGYAAYSYFNRAGYALAPVEQPADEPEPESPGGAEEFDPAAHNVAEVLAYLADADDAEKARVLAAEQAGPARKGVLGGQDSPITDPGADAPAEQNGEQA